MKKWFKYLVYFIITLTILVVAVLLYWGREQNIDFASMIPDSINYCDRQVTINDKEYVELIAWLKNNKNGWVNTPASYVSTTIFRSPQITINVLNDGVVINYSAPKVRWSQVSKSKNGNELLMKCKAANKSLNQIGAKDAPPG